jgi:hypothetical protein
LVPLRHAKEIGSAADVSVLAALGGTARTAMVLGIGACAIALAAIALYPHYAMRVFGL